jgi:hypothetical protein
VSWAAHDAVLYERTARALFNAEREYRSQPPVEDTEWLQYWSPGGPTAHPSLIAMRARAAMAVLRPELKP